MPTCSRCGEPDLPDEDFNPKKNSKSGFQAQCKTCSNKTSREYYHANKGAVAERKKRTHCPVKRRELHLKSNFGMSIAQFDAMLEAQGGACAICKTTTPGGAHDNFHVDHDHGTSMVRGLLCYACNTGIGKLKDSAAILRSAITYLEK